MIKPFDLLKDLDVIDGDRVRLERLSMSHHQGLCQSGLDDELWRFTISNVGTPVEMTNFITDALHQHEVGSAVLDSDGTKVKSRLQEMTAQRTKPGQ